MIRRGCLIFTYTRTQQRHITKINYGMHGSVILTENIRQCLYTYAMYVSGVVPFLSKPDMYYYRKPQIMT